MDGSSPCREVASIDEVEEVEVDIASDLRLRHTERRGARLLTAIPALIISFFVYSAGKNAKQAAVRERSARSSSGAGLFISEQFVSGLGPERTMADQVGDNQNMDF